MWVCPGEAALHYIGAIKAALDGQREGAWNGVAPVSARDLTWPSSSSPPWCVLRQHNLRRCVTSMARGVGGHTEAVGPAQGQV